MDFSGATHALSGVPTDWLIIFAFFLVVSVDALRVGSVRACALAISFPLSSLLLQYIPQTILIGGVLGRFSNPIEQALIFLVIEALLFVCLHQMLYSFDAYTSLFSAAASGLAATAVVLTVWTQMPALQSLWHFSPQIQSIFGASYRFFWLVIAYLALAFIGG